MGGRESTGREGKKRISLGKVGTAPSSTCCGDQVKGYFKVVAPQWDRMRQSFFTEEVRESAIGRAGLGSGSVVADVKVECPGST